MKKTKKLLAALLAAAILLATIPFVGVQVSAAGISDRLNALRTKFPDGKYWNHYANSSHNNNGPYHTCNNSNCMNPDGYTSTPCSTHNGVAGIGCYDCNAFDGAIQCWGFANKIFYDVFGIYASQMSKRQDTSNVAVGDWIRINNDTHSAVVLSRNGNNITIVEGNYSKNCMIKWDRTISISAINYFKRATNYDTVNNSQTQSSISVVCLKDKDTIGETNAILWGRVYKPSSYDVTEIGIYIRKKDSTYANGWSKTETPSQNYVGYSYMQPYYDLNGELNLTLSPGTEYCYKFFAVVNGSKYWGPEETFKTTGGHSHSYAQHYEAAHPHKVYMKCSCGSWYYTGAAVYLENCEKCNLKISYVLNGGKNNSGNPATFKTNAEVTLKNPTRSGYTFKGWYSDSGYKTKVTKIAKGTAKNITLYAKWEKAYTVTYKLNSGTNNSANPKTFTATTATITLKNPTRKGYTFKGWYSDAKFKTKVTKITKGTKKNITLYAKWAINTYKITYKLNSGKNNANNPKSYKVTTATITLKNPTRKGYTFKGWYSDSKYKTKVTKIAKGSTGNKTLYAKWAKK